jgi:Peptidase MA superfamily
MIALTTPRNRIARFGTVFRRAVVNAISLSVVLGAVPAMAATFETSNFRVTASRPQIAEQVALKAEELREELAREWLGEELPRWEGPCQILVDETAERMTGDTTYEFGHGRVRKWRMTLRGPLERIVESLLPHEIAHTVLASHFRAAIPRWADEGVALMAEDELDRRRVLALADSFVASDQRLALQTFLEADEYPTDRQCMRVLYAQAASFTDFLVLAGKQRFLQFVATGLENGWEAAAESTYGFASLDEVEQCWREWETEHRPHYVIDATGLLAEAARQHFVSESTRTVSAVDGPDALSAAGLRRAASLPEPASGGAQ